MNNSQQSYSFFIDKLATLDWIVFFAVLLITVYSIIYGHRKKKKIPEENESLSFMEYVLMGRQLTLPMFVATMVATWYGGIFGVTKIAYESGIYNFVTQGFFWYVSYLIFAIFILDKISKSNAVTLPDLIGNMFGPKSKSLSAIFNLFNVIPIAYIISLGLFLQILFGGSLVAMMMLGTVFVVIYSLFGGFRAIVYSDLIQFFAMCSVVAIVLFISIWTYGGLEYLQSNLPESYFSPLGTNTLSQTLVWGFIALSTLVDPNFYQRCFAAVDTKTAKKGIFISTFIWCLFDICTTFGAMYAKAAIEVPSDKAYLIYALGILPAGFKGLFLAGILATILSTLDSYLFIASTTLTYDLMPKKWRLKKSLHHLNTICIAILAILLAIYFNGNIKAIWKTLGSYSAACLLFPVLFGYMFPKKLSDNQFIFSCILGIIGVTLWRHIGLGSYWSEIDELYIGVLCTFSGICLSMACNLLNNKVRRD